MSVEQNQTILESISTELAKVEVRDTQLGPLHFLAYSAGYRKRHPLLACALWVGGGLVLGFAGAPLQALLLLLLGGVELRSNPEGCDLDELRSEFDPDYCPPQLTAGPAQPEIGEQTRLNALPVTAESVDDGQTFESNPFASPNFGRTSQEAYPHPVVYLGPEDRERSARAAADAVIEAAPTLIEQGNQSIEAKSPMDIAKYLAHNPKPTLITAVPRVGKGIVVAQAWREFKKQNPNGLVWVIQPKPHHQEAGYWEGVDRFWGEMLEEYLGDAAKLTGASEDLSKFVMDWRQAVQRPKLLIIDEAVKLQACLPRWYKEFLIPTIQVEASSGETDYRTLWVISQSPLVKDLGISTGNRSSLQFLTIQEPGSVENLDMVRSSFKSIPEPDPDVFSRSESPKKTVFYHSAIGEWWPMPNYPVYQPSIPVGASVTEPSKFSRSTSSFAEASWDFLDGGNAIQTPVIDGLIKNFEAKPEPKWKCVAEFLQLIKDFGSGSSVTVGDISRSSWASRWADRSGGIRDRKVETLQPFLVNAHSYGFIEPDGEGYKVTLK